MELDSPYADDETAAGSPKGKCHNKEKVKSVGLHVSNHKVFTGH